MQPATAMRSIYSLSSGLRKYSNQMIINGRTLLAVEKTMKISKRKMRHATEKNVICSSFEDIELPNCTLNEFIFKGMDQWPDKTAVVCAITGRGYTYSQMYKMCTAFAASLRNKLGLQDGDCVSIMLPNTPEFPLAVFGSIEAGCIVSTINHAYMADEISRQLNNSDAKVVITNIHCYPEIKKAVNKLQRKIPIMVTECNNDQPVPENAINFKEFAENFSENTDCLKEVRRHKEDTVFLPYSSGTTGLPKGVELSHLNLASNSLQMLMGKVSVIQKTSESYQENIMCVLPLYHIYGLTVTMLTGLYSGSKLIMLPKFKIDTFLDTQEKYRTSTLFLVPPLVLFLINNEKVNYEKHLSCIENILSGAAPLAETDIQRFLEKTKNKVSFMQGYGMTESSPVTLMHERGCSFYGSAGRPASLTEAKIVNVENSNEALPHGQTGELWVRGPQVMKGYYKNKKATDEILTEDKWLRTGDIGYYDENEFFYITERLKELIKVKGLQVAPAELEAILRNHPEVEDAAVIGVPHEKYGETPKAFVVKKVGKSPSADAIMKYVEGQVASFKKISDLQFIDEIPKSAAGKILRKDLKSKFA